MEVPRHWRTQSTRYALIGVVCQVCGQKAFPPRDLCPECTSAELKPFKFRGLGQVYSYSRVLQGPDGFSECVPYVVALIKLDEGPLLAAQLTDVDEAELAIGMRVEMVTRRLREDGPRGIVLYGYKFRPLLVKAGS
jgi:uncharacterized OB-fold protein